MNKENFNYPRFGTWCTHSGILPNYRGIASEFYSMLNNEDFIGCSIFKVNHLIDNPSIYFQKKFKINPKKSLFFNIIKNNLILSDFLNISLSDILNKKYKRKAIMKKPRYYSWPKIKHMRKFTKKNRIITVNEISNFLLRNFNEKIF